MSVIFKTLQKLRHTGQVGHTTYVEPRRKRRGYSSGRIFLPVGLIVAVALLVLSLAWWDSRTTMSHVENKWEQNAKIQKKVPSRAREAQASERISDLRELGNIAEPLFEKPLQTEGLSSDPSTVSGPYLLSPITKNQPKRESLRYMAPVTEGFPERKTIASTKQIHYLVPEKGREGVSRIQETVPSSPPLKQKTPIIISSVIPFSRPVEEPSQDTPTPEPEESPLSPAVGADAKFVSEGLLRNSGRERPEEVRKEQQASAGHMEKNHQVSDMDRSAEVSRLVARIQEGMRGGDKAMVVDLLGKLESIKGPGNDYVMRLRAFWFLKQGKYDAARRLLKALLEKDDNDIEAGVNMAILDIKTNHVQMARKRLLRMRRNNEDNALIPAIMEKISD